MIIKTVNGYVLGEVSSALQKTVRRGMEEETLFFAWEFLPRFERYLWRRLMVIVHEDKGVANPGLLQLVPTNRKLYFEFRAFGKDGAAQMVLANTLVLMCRSEKSRLGDHVICVINDRRGRGWRLPVPDFALDKHTGAGRRQGRGLEHWLTEGCKLVPAPNKENDAFRAEAEKCWLAGNLKNPLGGKESLDNDEWVSESDERLPLFRDLLKIEHAHEDLPRK